MTLVIDNYDSFTYNLVQLVALATNDYRVILNDELNVEQIRALAPDRILISPGPGRPEDAGVSVDVIRTLGTSGVPIFGVCLGHQAIGKAFGGVVAHAPTIMHGKVSTIRHSGMGTYAGVKNPFIATRYHSLVIDRASLPAELEITAESEDGVIMGVRHRQYSVEGVQFHPESILTSEGPAIIRNWISSPGMAA